MRSRGILMEAAENFLEFFVGVIVFVLVLMLIGRLVVAFVILSAIIFICSPPRQHAVITVYTSSY